MPDAPTEIAAGAAPAGEQTMQPEVASLGLRGIWAAVGNMSVLALGGVIFFMTWQAQLQQAHEDRNLFRETTDRQWNAIRETQRQQVDLMHSVQDNQQTLTNLTRAVQEMALELRALNRVRPTLEVVPAKPKTDKD